MNAIEEFKKDKNNFVLCITICATIWFLAVCILFGTYIYCSFNSSANVEQYANGSYNNHQEVSR